MTDSDITIVTNNVPRFIVEAYELSSAERAEFDYLDWPAIEFGNDSAHFVRYRGNLIDLHEFETTRAYAEDSPFRNWDGVLSDSFFSGLVIRYADPNCESVVVGRYFA